MGRAKGFNEYRIDGDTAVIFIEKGDGTFMRRPEDNKG